MLKKKKKRKKRGGIIGSCPHVPVYSTSQTPLPTPTLLSIVRKCKG